MLSCSPLKKEGVEKITMLQFLHVPLLTLSVPISNPTKTGCCESGNQTKVARKKGWSAPLPSLMYPQCQLTSPG